MSRRAALRFISDGFTRQSLCFALTSFTAFSCSLIPAGPVQADVDAPASAPQLTQQTSPTPSVQEVTTLELGKSIERELSGRQRHRYQITLAQGQYASVMVELRGVDIVVRLFAVDGQLIGGI